MSDPDSVLLSIGDFARAVGLPASALRHYDECGLLVPARTDALTGYRYYTPALEQRARLIAQMREVAVPIEVMRHVLDGTPDDSRRVLDGLARDHDTQAVRARAAIDTVRAALDVDRSAAAVRVRVDGPGLAAALRQVRPAADTRPGSALGAVLVDVRGHEVDVVATNRSWLACRTIAADAACAGEARALLPLAAVLPLAQRLDADDDVVLVLEDGRLSIDGRDPLVVTTSDQPFPAHRLILEGVPIPDTTIVVATEDLLAAVAGAGRSVVDVVSADDLVVCGRPVDAVVRGNPVDLRFRSALLLRAVGACVGPRVRVRLAASDRPACVGSPSQPGFVALLMPTLEPSEQG